MNFDIRTEWSRRSWWMNLLFLFCLYMAVIYVPYDLFLKPVAADEEVWFGFVLHGWWAKATGLLHWLVYGAGAYGFWKMAPWMWPWAALYVAQVAFSMLVWNLADRGRRRVGGGPRRGGGIHVARHRPVAGATRVSCRTPIK